MIKVKEKACKGINKAKGYKGCGKKTLNRKYGLCMNCYPDFILNTDQGKVILKKSIEIGKKKAEKERKKKIWIEKKESKVKNMSADRYRSYYVQPLINKIARLIDYGHPCIATGNYGKMNGGHFVSVGANRSLCLNLHNIFIQSFHSNHWKSGDPLKYELGLVETFGIEYKNWIKSLSQCPVLKLTKEDLEKIKIKAQLIIKKLNDQKVIRTSNERIELRNWANNELGIYDLKYSIY